MITQSLRSLAVPLAAVLLLGALVAGCGDNFFGVDNPGQIREQDLNSPQAMQAIVTGMSSDLSAELDQIAFLGARFSDEMAATGSYFLTGRARRGVLEDDDVNTYWEGIQRARFSAEDGVARMRRVLGENFGEQKELGARALFFAGISNRVFGENFNRVVFEGGEAQARTAAFERAIPYLEEAVSVAQTAGAGDIETAAKGGLAQVHMNLGNWEEAASYASQVPTDFVYNALFSRNSAREENEINNETHERYEMSALGTLAQEVGGPDDPRVPYTDCRENVDNGVCTAANGAGGNNPHLRQEKFPTLGSDIPLVKGTEMRLIEAEAAVRGEAVNLSEFTSQVNAVREHYDTEAGDAADVDSISQPSAVGSLEYPNAGDDALSILDRERHLTLWLEGRRLNDLTRWDHPFRQGGAVVYTSNIVSQRATIMPVAESECNNNENVECPDQEVYTP
jgi:hypothetical protein